VLDLLRYLLYSNIMTSEASFENILPPREQLELVIDRIFAPGDQSPYDIEYTKVSDEDGIQEIVVKGDENTSITMVRLSDPESVPDAYTVFVHDKTKLGTAVAGIGWRSSDEELPPRIFDLDNKIQVPEGNDLIAPIPGWLSAKVETTYGDIDIPNPFDPVYAQQSLTEADLGQELTDEQSQTLITIGRIAAAYEAWLIVTRPIFPQPFFNSRPPES
jgi:hypothetical protein